MLLAPRILPGCARRILAPAGISAARIPVPAHRRQRRGRCVAGSSVFESMTSSFCTLLLAAVVLVSRAAPAQGQDFGPVTSSRQGFWMGAGLGQGYTHLACSVCGGDRETVGLSGYFRAGGTLTNQFLLGGEITGWRRSQDGVTEHTEVASAAGYWYPNPRHGYYVKLGLGYALYHASEGDDGLTSGLFAAQLGAGYEMRVNPRISIVPFVNTMLTSHGSLNRENTSGGGFRAERVATDASLFVIQFGIGVTRH